MLISQNMLSNGIVGPEASSLVRIVNSHRTQQCIDPVNLVAHTTEDNHDPESNYKINHIG